MFRPVKLLTFLIALTAPIFANEPQIFRLGEEPTIRVGLATNVRTVSITTNDTQLTAASAGEMNKFLAVNKISVTARAYRPPEIEVFNLEIAPIATFEEAEQIAKDVREATGQTAVASLDLMSNTHRVRIGSQLSTIEEAAEFKELLGEKGFEEAKVVTEKVKQPSEDALAMSKKPALVRQTGLSTAPDIVQPALDPNLREVLVSGASPVAKYSSLKPVSFGSTSERTVPVRVNGRAYRGRVEVFVNNLGTLTVVNVVKLEDYVRGVVPNELGFPALEAQKAQAIAARSYALSKVGQFASQGFDVLPTTRSQVYKGYSSENPMADRAVFETKGIVATYNGKPIRAMYTSTCGGRTEDVKNIYPDYDAPYLKGVECSLAGKEQFQAHLIKSNRELPRLENEASVELTQSAAFLAVNGLQIAPVRFTDAYFAEPPIESELRNWLSLAAARLNASLPPVNAETAKPANFAQALSVMLYGAEYADTLLSASDVNYQLSFADADKIPANQRAHVAALLRDGWLSLYSDATLRPEKPLSRARVLNTILRLADKKKWFAPLQTGTARASENGKLIVQSGKSSKALNVRPDVFLFRQFGDAAFLVKEIALVGGESVAFHTNFAGEVDYLEVRPTAGVTTAEKMSPLAFWNVSLSPSAVQSRLSRYVRGIGTLYDVKIKEKGFSRRAIELEIVGSNGVKSLKAGKIRSALRLKEQLFVINKRYGANGTVTSYNFTGRGWGHGVGMCQYGAYGMAKMGVKYDRIVKHYYSGIDLTRAY
jgi:stage II sporulation protein D